MDIVTFTDEATTDEIYDSVFESITKAVYSLHRMAMNSDAKKIIIDFEQDPPEISIYT